MGNHWKFQPWIFGSKRARGSGTQRTSSSSRQSVDTRPMLMPVVYLPRQTNLAIGCLRGTSVSGCPVPGLSVHSPSGGRSTRLLTSWTCHPPTVSRTFYVSLLKPHTNSMSPSSPGPDKPEIPPPPKIDNDESIYRVNFILYSQSAGGRLEYLMDWEGFGPKKRCWVPRDDILDPSLLSEFHQLHPHKPAPRGRSRPDHWQRASGATHGGGGTVRVPSASSGPNNQPARLHSPVF